MDRTQRRLLSELREQIGLGNFTETDILAFLVLLREETAKGTPLREFGDLAAHREKDRGAIWHHLQVVKEVLHRPPRDRPDAIDVPFFVSAIQQHFDTVLQGLSLPALPALRVNQVLVVLSSLLQDVQVVDAAGKAWGSLVFNFNSNIVGAFGSVGLHNAATVFFPAVAVPNAFFASPHTDPDIYVSPGLVSVQCSGGSLSYHHSAPA